MAEGLVAYAVLPQGVLPAPDVRGLEGAPTHAVEAEGLALWVSAHHHAPSPGAAAAQAHHAVVAAALEGGVTPVPLRFGQWLEDTAAAHRVLRERAAEWHETLERLAGMVELGVRAEPARAGSAARSVRGGAAMDGTAYMRSLLERHAERRATAADADALADALHAAGADWIRQKVVDARPAWLSAAYLVGRADAPPLRDALQRTARERAVGSFAVTGPWPPYSFT
ncbi:MAG: GvpL/GvpF family gas vesicle protein [Gemmatimonadota bacterium]